MTYLSLGDSTQRQRMSYMGTELASKISFSQRALGYLFLRGVTIRRFRDAIAKSSQVNAFMQGCTSNVYGHEADAQYSTHAIHVLETCDPTK